jgi:hypothetical protein
MEDVWQYRYYDPRTLLVINAKGKLKVLYVPFRVLCVDPIGNLPLHGLVYVERVYAGRGNTLYFQVFGRRYAHRHFKLNILF